MCPPSMLQACLDVDDQKCIEPLARSRRAVVACWAENCTAMAESTAARSIVDQ